MAILKLAANAVTGKLLDADRDTRLSVSSLLSYMVQGAEQSDAFRRGYWDGRSTFYDFKTDTFPAGFLNYVYTYLSSKGHTVHVIRKPLPEPLGPDRPKVDEFGYTEKYDYQLKTVDALMRHGMMIAQVATGGGKSRIARIAYARIKRKTLFLTTRSILMHQMKDAFEQNLGVTVGVMGDSVWEPMDGFNVGTVQTFTARIRKLDANEEINAFLKKDAERHKRIMDKGADEFKKYMAYVKREVTKKIETHNARRRSTIKQLEEFEFVILEEAHEAGGNGYYDVLQKCRNAHYRLALTATPFMKDDEEANMRLMACSGSIGIQITEKMLIDREILARPYFKYVDLPKPSSLRKGSSWSNAYKHGVVENDTRNRHIVWEAERASSHSLPVMILVQRENHGKLLAKMLKEKGIRAQFISGKDKQKQRQEALNKLRDGEIQALIGSTILDVGVDVPAIGMVILAGGGKAEVALRQRIGRGLRAKKHDNRCFIVDFVDSGNDHLAKHGKTRMNIVKTTPGFAENILSIGEDFDF